jgi:hypothetical protein
VDIEIERLYSFIRCCCYRTDPRQIPAVLAELDTLFLEAISRQRHSPFIPLFKEDLEPGPKWIPEDGQLKAKPPREERVDPVEAVVKIVKPTEADGMKRSDIVKTLVQNSICSESTAYNWISSAVEQKKIKWLEKMKRYVVAS